MLWLAAVLPAAGAGAALYARASVTPFPDAPHPRPDMPGYGPDPDLFAPAPWPNLLTVRQREALSVLCDFIIPADETSCAASEAGAVDFIDEWVSSPYERTQYQRTAILNGLDWIDAESARRFGAAFVDATPVQQADLFEDVYGAYAREGSGALRKAISLADAKPVRDGAIFLDTVHYLTVTAFYMSEEGRKDIGYRGEIAMTGDYPGPSEAAKTHIANVLDSLGLEKPPELG